MKYKFLIEKLIVFIIVFSCFFDPIGSFYNLRIFSFFLIPIGILFVILRRNFAFYASLDSSLIFLFITFILPFIGVAVGIFRGGFNGDFIDTSYVMSACVFSLLILLSNKYLHDFALNIFLMMSFCLVLLIFISFISFYYSAGNISGFFVLKGVAYVSTRKYGGVVFPYIYFIVSPLLVLSICKYTFDFLVKKSVFSLFFALLFAMALIISGPRANMMAAVFCILFTCVNYYFGRIAWFYSFILVAFMLVIFYFSHPLVFLDMFDPENSSNSTKLDYIEYYNSAFNDLSIVIFGEGYNAFVWSYELKILLGNVASKTELTYLELFRVYGFLAALLFLFLLFFNIFKIKPDDSNDRNAWLHTAMVAYLIVSFLNPYLFSLNGMVVILIGVAHSSILNSKVRFIRN